MDSIGAIADAIRTENEYVERAYKSALANQALDRGAIDALEGALEDDLVDNAA